MFIIKYYLGKDLMSELSDLMGNPSVQSHMLTNIYKTLKSLVSGCKGIAQGNNKQITPLSSPKIPPNQKLVPQPRFFKTTRKRKVNSSGNEDVKSSLTDCDKYQPPPKQPKIYLSKDKVVQFQNNQKISDSFTFPLNHFKNISDPVVQVSSYKISILGLKSLDPFIPEDEEILIASQSSGFINGWLCDSVINSYFFKLMH